ELLLFKIQSSLSPKVNAHHVVRQAIQYLENNVPAIDIKDCRVCHGDVNHHNWLLSDTDELFLVDWEGAMIADPAIDLGMMLYPYIDHSDRGDGLHNDGVVLNNDLHSRMKRCTFGQAITLIQWYEDGKRDTEINELIILL